MFHLQRGKLRADISTLVTSDPDQHPIAIALRRQKGVDDARVTESETLVRRGKKWFRYDAPDKRRFKELQKTLADA